MKIVRVFFIIGITVFLGACQSGEYGLTVVKSISFPEQHVVLDDSVNQRLLNDSPGHTFEQTPVLIKLETMISTVEKLSKNPVDSSWISLLVKWDNFKNDELSKIISGTDSDTDSGLLLGRWADLNIELLKLSGEVRFGDEIERLLYKIPKAVLSEKQLKSVVYTHVDDKIFINVIGASGFSYRHTTGGNVRFLQTTDYPAANEMNLTCEVDDVRYMDVFIRIPSWAVNPTVTHGNVKYVAHPGEYCEIYRKWKTGDEISVKFRN